MAFDDELSQVLDRVLKTVREHLDDDFRALAHQLSQLVAAERTRVAATAAEAASAEIRQQAQQQLAQIRETTQKEIEDLRQRAAADIEDARRLAHTQVEDVQRSMEQRAAAARAEAEAADTKRAQQLGAGVASLDEARSLGDALERLTQAASAHAERAAIFIVRGGVLQEWRRAGFAAGVARNEIPLRDAGLLADVLPAAKTVRSAGAALPAFAGGGTDRDAAAFPVSVGGQVVAVLYCDAARQRGSAGHWPTIVELLARYASRVLETMTVQQATGLWAPPAAAQGSHL